MAAAAPDDTARHFEKIDPSSLPIGLSFNPLDEREAGKPSTLVQNPHVRLYAKGLGCLPPPWHRSFADCSRKHYVQIITYTGVAPYADGMTPLTGLGLMNPKTGVARNFSGCTAHLLSPIPECPGEYNIAFRFSIEPQTDTAVVARAAEAATEAQAAALLTARHEADGSLPREELSRADAAGASAVAAASEAHKQSTVFAAALAFQFSAGLPNDLDPSLAHGFIENARRIEHPTAAAGIPESYQQTRAIQRRLEAAGAFLEGADGSRLSIEMASEMMRSLDAQTLKNPAAARLVALGMRVAKRAAEPCLEEAEARSKRFKERAETAEAKVASAIDMLSGTASGATSSRDLPAGFAPSPFQLRGSGPAAATRPSRTSAALAAYSEEVGRASTTRHAPLPEELRPAEKIHTFQACPPFVIFVAIQAVREDASEDEKNRASARANRTAAEAIGAWLEKAKTRPDLCTITEAAAPPADPAATVMFGARDETTTVSGGQAPSVA